MAATHLQQVLKTIGLSDDQIKAINELPDQAEFKPETYTTPITAAAETRLKNDPKFYEGLNKENLPKEFLKGLENEQYGRAASIVRSNMLKAVGLTDKDFSDLGEEGKKIDVFTPAFVKKLSDGKVTDKELQAKLIEANQQIEDLKSGLPKLEEKFKSEYESKTARFTIAQAILSNLASVPGLKAPAKYLSSQITAEIESKYHLHADKDTGIVEVRQKDKPNLQALNSSQTKPLTLTDVIQQALESDNLIDKPSTQIKPTQTVTVTPGKGGLVISGNVNDKIQQRIAEDAKIGS